MIHEEINNNPYRTVLKEDGSIYRAYSKGRWYFYEVSTDVWHFVNTSNWDMLNKSINISITSSLEEMKPLIANYARSILLKMEVRIDALPYGIARTRLIRRVRKELAGLSNDISICQKAITRHKILSTEMFRVERAYKTISTAGEDV